MMQTPRVAAFHDLSAFGRCSLTVVMPVLSAMGVQCCPVPTAYLSTHTGGFSGMERLDMTGQVAGTLRHWEELGLTFRGVYTGYLGSAEQAELCLRAIRTLKAEGGVAVADPVLGDHGRLYAACTDELCAAMGELCAGADVITPNLTEAAVLLGREYSEPAGEGEWLSLAEALSDGGRRSVVLTGATPGEGLTGAACWDRDTRRGELVSAPKVEGDFHGTGDLFASVLVGGLVRGETLTESARRAARFVSRCAQRTAGQRLPRREGVDFEPLLGELAGEKGL